jgi:hypothetical protein
MFHVTDRDLGIKLVRMTLIKEMHIKCLLEKPNVKWSVGRSRNVWDYDIKTNLRRLFGAGVAQSI